MANSTLSEAIFALPPVTAFYDNPVMAWPDDMICVIDCLPPGFHEMFIAAERDLSARLSQFLVIPTNEELMIAQHTLSLVR
jgi:hypothetical protein